MQFFNYVIEFVATDVVLAILPNTSDSIYQYYRGSFAFIFLNFLKQLFLIILEVSSKDKESDFLCKCTHDLFPFFSLRNYSANLFLYILC